MYALENAKDDDDKGDMMEMMKSGVSGSKDLAKLDAVPPGFKLTPLDTDMMTIKYATSGFTGFPAGAIKAGGSASDFEEED